jgi:hypothetical protein
MALFLQKYSRKFDKDVSSSQGKLSVPSVGDKVPWDGRSEAVELHKTYKTVKIYIMLSRANVGTWKRAGKKLFLHFLMCFLYLLIKSSIKF